MSTVTIYTSAMCAYCAAAKRLLANKGIAFEEIDVTAKPGARATMKKRSGGRTSVPQIFFGDRHVGGFDELAELNEHGRLDSLAPDRQAKG